MSVRDARKLHRTRLPKNILFPSKLESGNILKNAKYMFNCAKVWNPKKYPAIANTRLIAIPAAAMTPTCPSVISEKE